MGSRRKDSADPDTRCKNGEGLANAASREEKKPSEEPSRKLGPDHPSKYLPMNEKVPGTYSTETYTAGCETSGKMPYLFQDLARLSRESDQLSEVKKKEEAKIETYNKIFATLKSISACEENTIAPQLARALLTKEDCTRLIHKNNEASDRIWLDAVKAFVGEVTRAVDTHLQVALLSIKNEVEHVGFPSAGISKKREPEDDRVIKETQEREKYQMSSARVGMETSPDIDDAFGRENKRRRLSAPDPSPSRPLVGINGTESVQVALIKEMKVKIEQQAQVLATLTKENNEAIASHPANAAPVDVFLNFAFERVAITNVVIPDYTHLKAYAILQEHSLGYLKSTCLVFLLADTMDDVPAPSPASSSASDSDAFNTESARLYFGPLKTPERKFVAASQRLFPPPQPTAVRRSPRLSSPRLRSASPMDVQTTEEDMEDIERVVQLVNESDEEDGDMLNSDTSTPQMVDFLPDEPSSVLADKIIHALDNPSPPPSPPTALRIFDPYHTTIQEPTADYQTDLMSLKINDGFEADDENPLFVSSVNAQPIPLLLSTTASSENDTAAAQEDLISFDSFSTPPMRRNTPDDVAREGPPFPPHATLSVDDLLSQSPNIPNSPSPRPQHVPAVVVEPPESEAKFSKETVAETQVPAIVLDHAVPEDEKQQGEASTTNQADTQSTLAEELLTTPLRRSTRPRRSVTPIPIPTPNPLTFIAPPSPAKTQVRKKVTAAVHNEEVVSDSEDEQEDIRLSPSRATPPTTIGVRHRSPGKAPFSFRRELGSLSPTSSNLLSALAFNATDEPGGSTDFSENQPEASSSGSQPMFSFSVFAPPNDTAGPSTPIRSTGPVRFASPPKGTSPDKYRIQTPAPGDLLNTPARRIPIAQAIAQGHVSPEKAVQLGFRPNGTPIASVPTPARRVLVSEAAAPSVMKSSNLRIGAKPYARAIDSKAGEKAKAQRLRGWLTWLSLLRNRQCGQYFHFQKDVRGPQVGKGTAGTRPRVLSRPPATPSIVQPSPSPPTQPELTESEAATSTPPQPPTIDPSKEPSSSPRTRQTDELSPGSPMKQDPPTVSQQIPEQRPVDGPNGAAVPAIARLPKALPFLDVFTEGSSRSASTRRKASAFRSDDIFSGMSMTALKDLTISNTVRNQKYLAANLETEVIRKEGRDLKALPSKFVPSFSVNKAKRTGRERSEPSDELGEVTRWLLAILRAPVENQMSDSDAQGPLVKHTRGAGDEDDYETPEKYSRQIKRTRLFGDDSDAQEVEQPKRRVKWDRGLFTTALRLDTLGNLPHADSPLADLVQENITVKKIVTIAT
ncbi:hypothetical protein BDZ97DRAFT_1761717 [Flammula alnicola]|nr:hypothetical protein BDZ97DRAFT_1761717 [Flammula alnicola]